MIGVFGFFDIKFRLEGAAGVFRHAREFAKGVVEEVHERSKLMAHRAE